MQIKKIRVGVLYGGKSAEHEVSISSALNVVSSLDKKKYELVIVFIDKCGQWFLDKTSAVYKRTGKRVGKDIAIFPGVRNGEFISLNSSNLREKIDVVFPIMHGTYGEDGTMQGLLKLDEIPFVGASVLGSSVGMDKDVMKRLLRDAGIPIAKFLVFSYFESKDINFEMVSKKLGVPFFIKPANLGSSVGIHKVKNLNDFKKAIKDAFSYDNKIILEEFLPGRELECAVLGNGTAIASVVGEIIPNSRHEFYSYEAKYLDEEGARLIIPAKLPKRTIEQIQVLAKKSFKTLCCEGMGRVDFFLNEKGVFVNEINTIPGFTKISMYPKLLAETGISQEKLVDRLIKLAFERFDREKKLKSSFS